MDFKNEFIIELMECILSGADELQVKQMLNKETQNLQLKQAGVSSTALMDNCKQCENNKLGYETGLWCAIHCVNGSKFKRKDS